MQYLYLVNVDSLKSLIFDAVTALVLSAGIFAPMYFIKNIVLLCLL